MKPGTSMTMESHHDCIETRGARSATAAVLGRDGFRQVLQEHSFVAGNDALAGRSEGADVCNEISDDLVCPNFLRIVGTKHDARVRQLEQSALDRPDHAGETAGVEDQVIGQVVVEILLRGPAMTRVAGGAPEHLVLVRTDAFNNSGNAATEVRHLHG